MAQTPKPAALPQDREVASLLSSLQRIRRVTEQHASLNAADGRLMWLFSDRQPRTMRQIAESLDLEQSTVNRQVNAALAAGLLSRDRESGRAAWLFEATDSGIERFERDLAVHLELLDQALGHLPAAEREHFLELLGTFVDGYGDAVRRQTWSRLGSP
ncbi:DNA-binding MarR family transcriptional regulator [Branchiibius hedensis]|uniref:DNA-binding transcriptional regulator, MarR family n=1 Tax=Branchiibius hedensis TaxID=672460 RepID=A0A2Y8ZWU1_9MICO|nr:MarR family winged helix-turn-helix transcriptional regulator [Branchiibius hedensis]PWJ27195.1 DNA-binding MarR family transcriptional regulator [Branchiibius hedensis]SSA36006.1 DNA-binding transcriptional regulator, MarR family [Branchiibius hedensis]